MAEAIINGRDGTADFTIDGDSYKCFLDMFRVREVVEMSNADTFCTEGSADQEPGRSQLQGECAGIAKKGIANAGPIIPAPQGVEVVMQYSTNCTITLDANFTEAFADRVVNQNARIGGRFLSKGSYVVAWDRGQIS